jgi:hypothetical protein
MTQSLALGGRAMTAAEIVDQVCASGAEITVAGDYLELAAPHPLPDGLLSRVAAHKFEIMKILRRQDTEAEDLREYFEERAGILEYNGGLPRADAERATIDQLLIAQNGGALEHTISVR